MGLVLPDRSLVRSSDQLEVRLRRLVIGQELPPGAVVTERYLGELLGCSRTPLREALQRLANGGILTSVPRRGVTIPELSFIEYGHLWETLATLEPPVFRVAAQRATESDAVALNAQLAELDESARKKDWTAWTEQDVDFHVLVAMSGRNPVLTEMLERLRWRIARFVYLGMTLMGADDINQDHRLIVDAVATNRAEEAENLLMHHITRGRQRMFDSLQLSPLIRR